MFKYNGKNILTPEEYEKGYRQNHPDKVPVKKIVEPKQATINKNDYVLMFVVLLAINVMSGGHTIPTIASLYTDWEVGRFVIAVFGFLGIEGALFILMARPERGNWAKFSIFVSFIAAILTNVYAVISLAETGNLFLGGIGVLLGFIVPVANLAFGNEFHKLAVQRQEEEQEIKSEYKNDLAVADQEFREAERNFIERWQTAYRNYLGRVGIKETTEKDYILSGFAELDVYGDTHAEKELPKREETKPKEERKIESVQGASMSKQIRDYLVNNPNAKNAEVAKELGTSQSLVSQVRNKIN